MAEYTHLFSYGGELAAELAKRKQIAIGADAKMLDASEAKAAGIKVPETADKGSDPVSHVVVVKLAGGKK